MRSSNGKLGRGNGRADSFLLPSARSFSLPSFPYDERAWIFDLQVKEETVVCYITRIIFNVSASYYQGSLIMNHTFLVKLPLHHKNNINLTITYRVHIVREPYDWPYILCKTSITSQEQDLTYQANIIRETLMNHTFFVKLPL